MSLTHFHKKSQKTLTVILFIIFFILFVGDLFSNQTERKTLRAFRIVTPPAIDGHLNDPIWESATPADNFLQYEPYNDRPATYDTYVWVLYDDFYLYIGAKMKDPEPDKILTELSLRDGGLGLNADQFGITINPFDDGIYGFFFHVSVSGVQTDESISHGNGGPGGGGGGPGGGGGNGDWDAVWMSATSITEQGWEAEIRIPYSALRFPAKDVQAWGINFWREIRRTRESSSWNFVDRRIGNRVASMGLLTGIEGIQPPLRLALFPYTSGYLENNGLGRGWAGTQNVGMDLKWGVDESFTVDMTLIPDFGQVQSDDRVLNLTPFEVRYDENRQFFTEGTELFDKADLFYSRRVGARPIGFRNAYRETLPNEIVTENPLETRLINATKLSGRTMAGLGIGIFNAMTAAGKAIMKDTITGSEREYTTQPFTNYSVVVLDQSLRNNSFVSLVNTNVAGMMDGYTGNVTGTDFRFLDRTGMFRLSGVAALSQQYYKDSDDNFGYKYSLSLGKFGGTWQYNYSREVISDTYQQNDLGFLRRNNLISDRVSFGYNIFDPFWKLLNFSSSFYTYYNRLYDEGKFTTVGVGFIMRALFESRFFLMFRVSSQPLGTRDHFEPRVPGRFYDIGPQLEFDLGYSTDRRRRIYINGDFGYQKTYSDYDQHNFSIEFEPTLRVSDRMNLALGIELDEGKNDIGYVARQSDNVFFGLRNTSTIENTFRTKYIFSNYLSLSFDLRHYWSRVNYKNRFFLLEEDGTLLELDPSPVTRPDINYNAFTIDAMLTWNFAPGSQMTVVWKNIIDSEQNELLYGYLNNMRNFLNDPQINSFSVKILYYLDYQTLRRRR